MKHPAVSLGRIISTTCKVTFSVMVEFIKFVVSLYKPHLYVFFKARYSVLSLTLIAFLTGQFFFWKNVAVNLFPSILNKPWNKFEPYLIRHAIEQVD
jgi:hypothetical protein